MNIGAYQRLTVETIELQIEKIKAAAAEGDHELAHSLEDELFHAVVKRLAKRNSPIARAALASLDVKFARRCS